MDFQPKIIFQDEDIAIIDKPAGMIVNRADTVKNQLTVEEWAEGKIKDQRLKIKDQSSDFYKRNGVVHRLDKETSGLLIIAKNEESFLNLQSQFKQGEVKKAYVALCHGKIEPFEGEIDVPIGRLPWNRMRFGIIAEGRQARSRYKVLSIKYLAADRIPEPLSLVEVKPLTGRTHQIRVHMKHIGHPIFADALYAGRKVAVRDRKLLPRHFLHAAKISFRHPKSGKLLNFDAPLPPELVDFIGKLN